MGGGSRQAGGGRSWEGSRSEIGCNDTGRCGSSGEAMYGMSEGESSTRCRVDRGRGGAGGRMVSGANEQRTGHHEKENQHLCQIKQVVERRHQKTKKDGRASEKENMEFPGGFPGEGRSLEVDPRYKRAMRSHYLHNLKGAEV